MREVFCNSLLIPGGEILEMYECPRVYDVAMHGDKQIYVIYAFSAFPLT